MAISVGILGASGYTGCELLRILANHPHFEVRVVTAFSEAGKMVGELFPSLQPFKDLQFLTAEAASAKLEQCELIFLALPHGESMEALRWCGGARIVDLSSDFRLTSPSLYEQWYGRKHIAPQELGQWVYGLPELFRETIRGATKVANPGCFATAITLALAPFVCEDIIEGPVVVDAVSSLSGAGKTPSPRLHFSHACDDVVAYKHGNHQHTGEIEQSLERISRSGPMRISLTTHLVPLSRGIHATCSAALRQVVSRDRLHEMATQFFRGEPFVEVMPLSPSTKMVRGSNVAALGVAVDERTNRVIITSVIDNLVKGASGAAVQNANIIFGLPEHEGLPTAALYP